MQHYEIGNPFTNQLYKTYFYALKEIMKYLRLSGCSNSIIYNPDFGTFPYGSYAKVGTR